MSERLYTYQALAAEWSVSVRTIQRWFASVDGLVAPTKSTVRIPESVAESFKHKFVSNGRKKSQKKSRSRTATGKHAR